MARNHARVHRPTTTKSLDDVRMALRALPADQFDILAERMSPSPANLENVREARHRLLSFMLEPLDRYVEPRPTTDTKETE